MTADWFDDLAERCGDAARYAVEYDEPSMARELLIARQDAEDLAQSLRVLLESPEVLAPTEGRKAVASAERTQVT